MQLWDIAGQERFGTMTRVYYKDAAGAILVFDITDRSSFDAVEQWRQDLYDKLYRDQDIPMILLANKADMINENTPAAVTDEEIDDYCNSRHFVGWYTCSAKDGVGVNDSIENLLERMLQYKKEQVNNDKDVIDNLGNQEGDKEEEDDGSCC
eukprot:TRINITY_DN2193_c0_g2_i1.p1 TRINITY_DN2193_c0_g2~~TRINITY_DN2193_c0_g2_i1.p1  ORF type:complete len:152 (+),score=36.32 TRINITY_DN2193_c0_g2_i1:468-923(+)